METQKSNHDASTESVQPKAVGTTTPKYNEIVSAFSELERGVYAALETYSNVHRGSGHNSVVTTHLFERARAITLEYLGLSKSKYVLIFCSPRRAIGLMKLLKPDDYQSISSQDIGLSLGVWALAVKRRALPKGAPNQVGGGTTKLISKDWVIWADLPERFEAGTPAIVNIIAFAKALRLIQQSRKDIFIGSANENRTVSDILYHDELEEYSGPKLLSELKKTLIGRGLQVPTIEGLKPFINLDNSASTPTFTPIWNAFRQTLRQPSQHKQEIIQEVKLICSKMLGAPLSSYDAIFTSNTTEAINLAAENFSRMLETDVEPVILNTLLEHSSNELPWRLIPNSSLLRLSVNEDGFVDLNETEQLMSSYNQNKQFGKKRIKLVAVSGASNVLGICNNLEEISRIVHQYGAQLLVDGAQMVAHRKISMEECGIDYLAFSAHKIYAPFGSGVLIVRKSLLNFSSAELEQVQSSGEENLGGIAALGKSFVLLQRIGMDVLQEEERGLTKHALQSMSKIEGLKVYGVKDPDSAGFTRKIGVIVFGLKGMMPNRLAKELSLQSGIGVRYGCHCSHIIVKHILKVPPFIEQFQRSILALFPKLRLPGLTRVSLGIENSKEDVDRLIHVLSKIAKRSSSTKYEKVNLSKVEAQKQINDFIKAAAMKVYA